MVNHPSHYTQGSMECIDAIVGAYGAEEAKVFCKINAFKYLWRLGHKDAEAQEIGKIKWYLDKYIELDSQRNTHKVEELCGFKVGDEVSVQFGYESPERRQVKIREILEYDCLAIFYFTDNTAMTFVDKSNIESWMKKL